MDLCEIIPTDDKWIVSKDIVYVKYIAKIPILVKKEDDIFVYLDMKIYKFVLKLVKILNENNIEFLFRSNMVWFEHKFNDEDIHHLNIKQQLVNICNPKFFDGFNKIGFDFTKSLTNYITKYQCHDEFKRVYEYQRDIVTKKTYDYLTGRAQYSFREDIRDFISTLEREIKINMLF